MSHLTTLQLGPAPSPTSSRTRPQTTLSDDFFLHLRDILQRDSQYATAANLMAVSRAFYDLYSPLIDYARLTLKEDNVEQILWGAHPDHVQKSLGSPHKPSRKLSNLNKCSHLKIQDLPSLRHMVDQYGNLASRIFTAVTHLSLGRELVLELAFRTDEELDRYFHGMETMFAPLHVCVDYPTPEAAIRVLNEGLDPREKARIEFADGYRNIVSSPGYLSDSHGSEAMYASEVYDAREEDERILDILDIQGMVLETVGGDWYTLPAEHDENMEQRHMGQNDHSLDYHDHDLGLYDGYKQGLVQDLSYKLSESVPNFVNWLVRVWAPDSVTLHGVRNETQPESPRAPVNHTRFRIFFIPQDARDPLMPDFCPSRLGLRVGNIVQAIEAIGNTGTCFFELIGAGMTGSEDGGSETSGEAMTKLSGETSGEGHPEHFEDIEADEELEDPEAEIRDIFYEGYLVDRKILDQMVQFVSTAEAEACTCCGGK